jgi:hypothetical protein
MVQVGMTLIAFSIVAAFLWWYSAGYLFLIWYWSYQIPTLTFAILMVSPSIALTTAGLALYIGGRKGFWKMTRKPRVLLAVLGPILILLGGSLSWFYYSMSAYESTKHGPPWDKPLVYILADNSPYFVLFALWLISGVILLADAMFAKEYAHVGKCMHRMRMQNDFLNSKLQLSEIFRK